MFDTIILFIFYAALAVMLSIDAYNNLTWYRRYIRSFICALISILCWYQVAKVLGWL